VSRANCPHALCGRMPRQKPRNQPTSRNAPSGSMSTTLLLLFRQSPGNCRAAATLLLRCRYSGGRAPATATTPPLLWQASAVSLGLVFPSAGWRDLSRCSPELAASTPPLEQNKLHGQTCNVMNTLQQRGLDAPLLQRLRRALPFMAVRLCSLMSRTKPPSPLCPPPTHESCEWPPTWMATAIAPHHSLLRKAFANCVQQSGQSDAQGRQSHGIAQ